MEEAEKAGAVHVLVSLTHGGRLGKGTAEMNNNTPAFHDTLHFLKVLFLWLYQ